MGERFLRTSDCQKSYHSIITGSTVEVLFKNKRVARHARSYEKWKHMTLAEHMPKSHQKYLEGAPSRIILRAGKNGLRTETLVSLILESQRHPESVTPVFHYNILETKTPFASINFLIHAKHNRTSLLVWAFIFPTILDTEYVV